MAKKDVLVEYDKKRPIAQQRYETVLAHILDPENSPLPEELQDKFNRIVSAAKLLDSYHPANVYPRLIAKYNITSNTAREDVKLAQELFKSKHSFDFDYWQHWQIKDLVDEIRTCKAQGKHKEVIAAHKVLRQVIGEKQVTGEDPKRMEKNVFYIQLNNNQTTVNIPLNKIKDLSPEEVREVISAMVAPDIDDAEIVDILNT